MPSGPFADIEFNPFGEEDGFLPEKGRKRTKFARESGSWKFTSRTPSPTKNDLDHDSSLGTEDEEIQERNPTFNRNRAAEDEGTSETLESTSSSPELIRPFENTDFDDVEDLAVDMGIEAETPRPGKRSPRFASWEEMPPPRPNHTNQEGQSSSRTPRALTPRLEPLASPGLPLVSPLIKQTSFFAGGYFPPQITKPSELDASAQLNASRDQDSTSSNSAISTPSLGPQKIGRNRRLQSLDLQLEKTSAPDLASHSPINKTTTEQPLYIDNVHKTADRISEVSHSHNIKHVRGETITIENTGIRQEAPPSQPVFLADSASSEHSQPLHDFVGPTSSPNFRRSIVITDKKVPFGYDGPPTNFGAIEKDLSFEELSDYHTAGREDDDLSFSLRQNIATSNSHQDHSFLKPNAARSGSSEEDEIGAPDKLERRETGGINAQGSLENVFPVEYRPTVIDTGSGNIKEYILSDPISTSENELNAVSLSTVATPSAEAAPLSLQDSGLADDSYRGAITPQHSKSESMTRDREDGSAIEEAIEKELAVEEEVAKEHDDTIPATEDNIAENSTTASSHPSSIESVAQESSNRDPSNPEFDSDSIQVMPYISAPGFNMKQMTPNKTQESLQPSPSPERRTLLLPGLITPEHSQSHAEVQDTMVVTEQLTATDSQAPEPTMRRRSSRILRKPPEIDTPQISSPWFTPRHASQIKQVKTEPDSNSKKSLISAGAAKTSFKSPTSEEPFKALLRHSLTKGYRTTEAFFPTLSSLFSYFNQTVDVIVMATSQSTSPKRAPSGPRDHYITLHVTDPTLHGTTTSVQIFRPYKSALPSIGKGEVVLLRSFRVQSRNRKMELLSTESSGWAVFHSPGNDEDEGEFDPNKGRVTITGPPVEFGQEEVSRGDDLATWWQEEGSGQFLEATNIDIQTTRGHRTFDSIGPSHVDSKDSIPQSEPGRKSKMSDSSKSGPTIVHELRDGTKYFDPMPGSSSPIAHELRDGTKWFDNVARGSSESRPGSRG